MDVLKKDFIYYGRRDCEIRPYLHKKKLYTICFYDARNFMDPMDPKYC